MQLELTSEELRAVRARPCVYCGGTKSVGVDRVDNGVGCTTANAACKGCNPMKKVLARKQCWGVVRHSVERTVRRTSTTSAPEPRR